MSQEKTATQSQEENRLNWPPQIERPDPNPSIILIFHGLMGLAYNNLGFCEVGMHSKAPDHSLSVEVYSPLSRTNPIYKYTFGSPNSSPVDIIRLDVVDPTKPGVTFYMPEGFESDPMRGRTFTDDLDFRHITDFESPDFYDRQLVKKPGIFKPRLHVKNGTFVTLLSSGKEFKRVAPNDLLRLGQIAEFIGTFIYLNPDGFVALRIGSEELRIPAVRDNYSIIYFNNSCPDAVCNFIPESPKKEKRNDFYLYYETFDIPEDKEEYELFRNDIPTSLVVKDDPSRDSRAGEIATTSKPTERSLSLDFLSDFLDRRSNPEAPCGAAGFGQSGGLGGGG